MLTKKLEAFKQMTVKFFDKNGSTYINCVSVNIILILKMLQRNILTIDKYHELYIYKCFFDHFYSIKDYRYTVNKDNMNTIDSLYKHFNKNEIIR